MDVKDRMLYPNCSEATMRLNVSKLSPDEVQKIMDLLADLEENHYSGKKDDNGKEDNENNLWYDTYYWQDNFFGIPAVVIKGEVPYNCQDWLELNLSKLPFWDKVESECN